MQSHILVIDDEPQMRHALHTILAASNFCVTTASTGEEGLLQAAANPPDVIILDLTLPKMDGLEVCARLREWTQLPIIVLSVRDAQQDKVAALDRGADDYLTKPFGIEELLARVRVALRYAARMPSSQDTLITSRGVAIDLVRHLVTRANVKIKLSATEYKLLAYLATHADRVLTHQTLLSHVWGAEHAHQLEYLRVYMRQLRIKIETDPDQPQILLTEPGIGYRFIIAP